VFRKRDVDGSGDFNSYELRTALHDIGIKQYYAIGGVKNLKPGGGQRGVKGQGTGRQ